MKFVDKKILFELSTRRRIYAYIYKFPGNHISKISRDLKISKSTLIYHLKYLEKRDVLGFVSTIMTKLLIKKEFALLLKIYMRNHLFVYTQFILL